MDYPTNPALEAAVRARPDEDTPRLAYADWLDDHGDPGRAEFVRVQCRLAAVPPAAPEWLDLRERQDELVCRLRHRALTAVGTRYSRFYFGTRLLGAHEEPYRRGFPFFIGCQVTGAQWTADEARRVLRDLAKLVRETTVRGYHPYSGPVEHLMPLLDDPVLADLRGLAVLPEGAPAALGAFYRALGACPAARGLEHLFLYAYAPAPAVEGLAAATALDSVRRLTLRGFAGAVPEPALKKLTRAPWFRRLHQFRCELNRPAEGAVLKGLGDLPDLHTLDLPEASGAGAFAGGKFPALARLLYGGEFRGAAAQALAKAEFPALVEFHAARARADTLKVLLGGAWAERLRVLNLESSGIGDAGVRALAAHPVARGLRHLHLGDTKCGKGTLAALGAFPALTVLDVGTSLRPKATPADAAAFLAALAAPLRHLNLRGWPLGNAGARALAANPALAGLTRLNVEGCDIGSAGARELLAAPHLRNLVELEASDNRFGAAARALEDPAVLPALGACWLNGNRAPQNLRARCAAARPALHLVT